mmetsp:Transcript_41172/g.133475  ORF Transcript_41172/g.133475 Transcript_41172/m.133475 type:complete len:421 (+) Transcript_41172:561-1823(+)
MAAGRLPGRAGPVLLRRWRRPLLWPLHLRGALQGLPLRRHRHLGHQRRGDAWPVGVPGWAVRWHRRGRRADGRDVAEMSPRCRRDAAKMPPRYLRPLSCWPRATPCRDASLGNALWGPHPHANTQPRAQIAHYGQSRGETDTKDSQKVDTPPPHSRTSLALHLASSRLHFGFISAASRRRSRATSCSACARISASTAPSTRSPSTATGTAPAATPTSPPRRCARLAAAPPSTRPPRQQGRAPSGRVFLLYPPSFSLGHPPAGRAPLGPHRRVRRGQRAPADRQARDGRHEHLLVRRRQPRLLDPHPPLRRGGRLRLPRGPPPVLQHGPVRGHVDDLRDDRRGQRGARHPGVVRRARLGGPTRLWPRFLWSPPPPRPSPPSTPTTSPPPPPPPGRGCARAAFGLTSERARISPVLGRRASG